MAKGDIKDRYYAVWSTAWGPVGAVAGELYLRRFVLPNYQRDDLKDLIAWEHPKATYHEAPFELLMELTPIPRVMVGIQPTVVAHGQLLPLWKITCLM